MWGPRPWVACARSVNCGLGRLHHRQLPPPLPSSCCGPALSPRLRRCSTPPPPPFPLQSSWYIKHAGLATAYHTIGLYLLTDASADARSTAAFAHCALSAAAAADARLSSASAQLGAAANGLWGLAVGCEGGSGPWGGDWGGGGGGGWVPLPLYFGGTPPAGGGAAATAAGASYPTGVALDGGVAAPGRHGGGVSGGWYVGADDSSGVAGGGAAGGRGGRPLRGRHFRGG